MPTSPPSGGGGGNFLTRKIGPMPMFVWILGGVAVAYYFSKKKAGASGSSATGQSPYGVNYVPPSGGSALGDLVNLLAAQQMAWGSPGNPPANGAVSPGNTGIPGIQPANQYMVGQNVGPGESIVQGIWDPKLNEWLNLTNKGGVYTSGGSTLLGDSSYLGYAQQRYGSGTPSQQQELALHGNFSQGHIAVLPSGGYRLTNSQGETYNFGS